MTTTSNQPTHLVYHVEEREGNDANNWTRIGALWPHRDGKGWNMKLDYLPIGTNGQLTIRVNEPRDSRQAA